LSRLKKEKAKGVYIAEGVVMRWTIQIALALQYLHARNILHRDLKTQNIFLTKSDLVKVGPLYTDACVVSIDRLLYAPTNS